MGKKKFNLGKSLKSVGKALKPVGKELQNTAKVLRKDFKEMATAPNKLLDKGLDKLGGLGLPLMIAGGVVLFLIVKNQK
jgi:hypothetical protein